LLDTSRPKNRLADAGLAYEHKGGWACGEQLQELFDRHELSITPEHLVKSVILRPRSVYGSTQPLAMAEGEARHQLSPLSDVSEYRTTAVAAAAISHELADARGDGAKM
jgi:hypothetical protein